MSLAVLGGVPYCECEDFRRRLEPCKHLFACELYRAKIQRKRWEASKAEAAARHERDLEHVGGIAERVLSDIL